MKKHLPFFFYAIFSTFAVIIAIILPEVLSPYFKSNITRQVIAGVLGVLISLLGSWITYINSFKEMNIVKKTTSVVEDIFTGKRTLIIDGNAGDLPRDNQSSNTK